MTFLNSLSYKLKLVVLALAMFIVMLAVTNVFPSIRIDLTENKLYTISQGTENLIDQLESPVTLKLFFSEAAAKDVVFLRNYHKRVKELLDEYAIYGDGNVIVELVDPEPFSEAEDQAAEYGLQSIPLTMAGEEVYFGLVGLNANEDVEVISFLQPDKEEFLEYDVSKLIFNLSQSKSPVIGLISGLELNGGFDMRTGRPNPPWMIMDQLDQFFEVRPLGDEMDSIEEDIDILMVVQPETLVDDTLYAIDQFVLKGGNLIVFIDPVAEANIKGGMPAAPLSDNPLAKLFEQWGVSFPMTQVAVDAGQALMVSVGQVGTVQHLGLLGAGSDSLQKDDVVTSQLENINFATPGHFTQIPDSVTTFIPLISTNIENSAIIESERFMMLQNPRSLLNDFQPSGESYVLSARLSGAATTAFPEGLEGMESAAQVKESDNINVLLVADTDLLTDRLWVQVQNFFGQRVASPWADNGTFVTNAMENLAGNADLISIRSRGRYSRPFDVVQDLQKQAEARFQQKEQELQLRLTETEQTLKQLQEQNKDSINLSPEQEMALKEFQLKKLSIRKELRTVRHELDKDIEALGSQLKMINIALIPLLLTLLVLGRAFIAKRNRN